jgi:hypothetical protein
MLNWFRKKKVVAVVPELIAVRKNTYLEYPDDGPIIGYELRWKTIKDYI